MTQHPDNESRMVIAHQLGVKDATSHFAIICQRAMNAFETPDQQFSYISGYIMELTRIARRHGQENKGDES
jgi:hypothetical protein